MGAIPGFPSWPANETETMLEAACRRPDQRPAFDRAVLSAKLYLHRIPGQELDLENWDSESEQEPPVEVVRALGEKGVAAYTSEQLLKLDHPDDSADHDVVAARLFKLIPYKWLIINPRGPYSVCLSPTDFKALLAGESHTSSCRFQFLKETPIQLLPLDSRDGDLLDSLTSIMKAVRSVRCAYIGRIQYETGPPVITIGLAVWENFEYARGEVIRNLFDTWLKYDGTIDFIDATRGSRTSELAWDIRTHFKRFYTRSWFDRLLA